MSNTLSDLRQLAEERRTQARALDAAQERFDQADARACDDPSESNLIAREEALTALDELQEEAEALGKDYATLWAWEFER